MKNISISKMEKLLVNGDQSKKFVVGNRICFITETEVVYCTVSV